MSEIWRLVSLIVCLAGFVIVAGVTLATGEDLLYVALRAVLTFAGLYAVQSVLRALLALAATSGEENDRASQ